MLVTFNIKNFKLLKNAFIFSILGILRNAAALIGMALLIGIHIFLFVYTMIAIPSISAVTIVIPFIYILATVGFMGTYAAYPVIQKYMIAPAQSAEDPASVEAESNSSDE